MWWYLHNASTSCVIFILYKYLWKFNFVNCINQVDCTDMTPGLLHYFVCISTKDHMFLQTSALHVLETVKCDEDDKTWREWWQRAEQVRASTASWVKSHIYQYINAHRVFNITNAWPLIDSFGWSKYRWDCLSRKALWARLRAVGIFIVFKVHG